MKSRSNKNDLANCLIFICGISNQSRNVKQEILRNDLCDLMNNLVKFLLLIKEASMTIFRITTNIYISLITICHDYIVINILNLKNNQLDSLNY